MSIQMNEALRRVCERKTNTTDVRVGRRLRVRRKMMDMTQERLAGLMKLTFQQIQKYEKGANRIGASRLHQLSQILNVPTTYFFEDEPLAGEPHATPSASAPLLDFLATEEGGKLVRAFSAIKSATIRKQALAMVRALAGEEEEAA